MFRKYSSPKITAKTRIGMIPKIAMPGNSIAHPANSPNTAPDAPISGNDSGAPRRSTITVKNSEPTAPQVR